MNQVLLCNAPQVLRRTLRQTARMRNYMAAGWFYSPQQIKKYLLSRPSSLKPPKTKLRNPIGILKELDKHQWLLFAVGFAAWTWDSFDFFTVSLCVTEIATDFGKENSAVTVSCSTPFRLHTQRDPEERHALMILSWGPIPLYRFPIMHRVDF